MLDIICGVELYFFERSGCLKGCLTWYGWENKFAFGLFGICSIVQSCLQKLLSIITSVTGVENITKNFVDDDGSSYGSGCARVMVDSDVQVVMHRSTPDISGRVSFRSSPSLSFCECFSGFKWPEIRERLSCFLDTNPFELQAMKWRKILLLVWTI